MAQINLDITLKENIDVSLEKKEAIRIDFGHDTYIGSEITPIENDIDISLGLDTPIDIDFGLDEDTYTGEYETTSSINEQVLPTANKKMMGNVVINPIPYSRVPSPHNKGYTVTIG